MGIQEILQQVQNLSIADKLTLIERTVRILRQDIGDGASVESVSETKASYTVDTDTHGKNLELPLDDLADAGIDAMLRSHLSSPDPDPSQMLHFGMFEGRIPLDEKYFRLAEWHPSPEDLAGV